MKKVIFTLLASAVFISCGNDDDFIDNPENANPPLENILQIIKMETLLPDGTLTDSYLFYYNNDNLLFKVEETSTDNPNTLEVLEYSYNDGNLIKAIHSDKDLATNEIEQGIIIEYTYVNDILKYSTEYASTTINYTWSYNSNGLLEIMQSDYQNEKKQHYYDANNNVIESTYSQSSFNNITFYEYDTSSNYFQNVYPDNFYKIYRLSSHNITKITREANITTYEYEYNSSGYPIGRKEFSNGVFIESSKFYYN